MHITALKVRIATYLQRRANDYVVDGVDLLLDTINESHRYALKQYDFEFAKCSVDVTVDLQNGAPYSPLPLHTTCQFGTQGTLVPVKKILGVWITDQMGNDRPMKFVGREWQREDLRQRWAGIPTPFAPVQRDMPAYPTFYETYLTQLGTLLFLYPSATTVFPQNPVPLHLDIVGYYPDYSNDDDNSDFLLQYGSDYLAWDSICRLNPLTKEFVPRQEGNVAPPTDERDKAWQDLLAWDAQLIVTGEDTTDLD